MSGKPEEESFASVADLPVYELLDNWNVFVRYPEEDKSRPTQYQPKSARMLGTVEDVWCYLFELQPTYRKSHSEHKDSLEIAVFRQGISPEWEDPKNENGSEYRFEEPLSLDDSSFERFRDGVCFPFQSHSFLFIFSLFIVVLCFGRGI